MTWRLTCNLNIFKQQLYRIPSPANWPHRCSLVAALPFQGEKNEVLFIMENGKKKKNKTRTVKSSQ